MPVTRDQVEREIAGRARVALRASGIAADAVNDPTPRPYLNEPIRRGLAAVGHHPADPFSVTDADFALVGPGDLDDLFAVAELAVLEAAYLNIDAIDVRTTDLDHKYSQYAERLARLIERKRAELADVVDPDVAAPEAGVIVLGSIARPPSGGDL